MADQVIAAATAEIHDAEDGAVPAVSDDIVEAAAAPELADDTRGGRIAVMTPAAIVAASQATATATADPDHSGAHTVPPPPAPGSTTEADSHHSESDTPDEVTNPYLVHDDPADATVPDPADDGTGDGTTDSSE